MSDLIQVILCQVQLGLQDGTVLVTVIVVFILAQFFKLA